MVIPLQKTKLFIPPARETWVNRPRLVSRLDSLRAEGCRAALVSAPAGSGKTTITVQWLKRQGIPAGWLSLDERDNLPARFFSYLVAALQGVVPGAGREAQVLLDLPGAGPEEIVTLLTNDLAETPGQFILVLDDFHTITNPLLHQTVDFLIEAQPPQMRLILLSREDPILHLARRRARGQLVELRQADLSFTLDEAGEFLQQNVDFNLTTGQVAILEARTEGWIAGLQMASLAMRAPAASDQTEFVERFLRGFSGSHRFILDYLMEEVLARQDAEVQTFLLETSILDRLQAGLCAAVTKKTVPEAQRLLDQISRANLFIIPLEENSGAAGTRPWYRYHHLFGDLLLARFQSENPGNLAGLFLRASDWYEENGDPRLAVEYALKAEAPRRAADLIEQHITERWQTVDIEFFRLVNRLPFEVIAERPSLCLQSAWLCVIYGQNDRILPFVEAAERALDRFDRPTGLVSGKDAAASRAFARTLHAYLANLRNQPVALDESLELAYTTVPENNPGMRNSVAVIIGMICFMEADFTSAMRFYENALALDIRVNGTNAVPIATTRICFVLQAQGRLREAMHRLRDVELYMYERGVRRFYISGAIHQRMADLLLEWNQLDEAEFQLQKGTRLMEDWPMPTTRSLGLTLLARLRTARGDLAGARNALEQADSNALQAGLHPFFLDALEHARLQLFLAERDRSALEAWARANDSCRQSPLAFRYEARQIELCLAWIALGRVEEAVAFLALLAEAARDRNGSRVRILALLAAYTPQPEVSLPILEEVLGLAEPEGFLRTFLEAGEPFFQALRLWLQRGPSKDDPRLRRYAMSILSALDQIEPGAISLRLPALPEPLSQREQEVLVLIAKGLTNQQIADRLVISVRTVKKHVENIHGKLGVLNRTQAVVRAQELGLIK